MYLPILLTLLKMRPHDIQSNRENATPSSGKSPVASYKEVPPPPPGNGNEQKHMYKHMVNYRGVKGCEAT